MKNKSLVVSSISVSAILTFGYIFSFIKEAVVAGFFGVSKAADAYTLAIQIPVVLFAFLAVAIQSVVIPLYSDKLHNIGKDEAGHFAVNFLNVLLVISLILIFIGEVGADYIVNIFAPGFDLENKILACQLLRISFPTIILTATTYVLTAVLNAHKQFSLPSVSVCFLNLGLIVTIILFSGTLGIQAACWGQVVGGILQTSYILFLARKYIKYRFICDFADSSTISAVKMALPVVLSVSVAEINAFVNKIVASYLTVGSIAALNYASKLNMVFMSLMVAAVSTVIYPIYAETTAKNDLKGLNSIFNKTLSAYSMLILPLVVGLLCFKREIVLVAFARGAFDAKATEITQELFGFYTIGLFFMAIRETVTKLFYSMKDTKSPAINATIGIIFNIALNLTLPFIMGPKGLALATSISAMFISGMLIMKLLKKNIGIDLNVFFKSFWKIVLAACIMGCILFIYKNSVDFDNKFLTLIIGGFIGLAVYIGLVFILKTEIMYDLISNFKNGKTSN